MARSRSTTDFRGDIGGFGAGSDLAWNLIGQVRYWTPFRMPYVRPWLAVGYRALAFDQTVGGTAQDMQQRGPYMGVGLGF